LGFFFLNKVGGKKSRSLLALLIPPFLVHIVFEVTFLYKAKCSTPPVPQSNMQTPLNMGLHVSYSFFGTKHMAKQEAR